MISNQDDGKRLITWLPILSGLDLFKLNFPFGSGGILNFLQILLGPKGHYWLTWGTRIIRTPGLGYSQGLDWGKAGERFWPQDIVSHIFQTPSLTKTSHFPIWTGEALGNQGDLL